MQINAVSAGSLRGTILPVKTCDHDHYQSSATAPAVSAASFIQCMARGRLFVRPGQQETVHINPEGRSAYVSELLPMVLPFCPRRVLAAFSAGHYHDIETGAAIESPKPRKLCVALLLVRAFIYI